MADRVREIMRAISGEGAVRREEPLEHAPHSGTAYRREPVYEPRETVEYDQDAQVRAFPTPDTHGTDKVLPPRVHEPGYRIAYPQRTEVVVGRFKRSVVGVLDGTGGGVFEYTNAVPANQTWLIDRVVARSTVAAANGTALLYETAQNDDGLLVVLNLNAQSSAQQDGNPIEASPGSKLLAVFIGAGNAGTATMRIFYRIVEYVPGRPEDATP